MRRSRSAPRPSVAPVAGSTLAGVATALARAGCVAAEEEAAELLQAAAERAVPVDRLLERRVTGEPLAWITGSTTFCGLRIRVDPGVYVPRWQTEPMALLAADALSEAGIAIDLCTGSGAVAAVLSAARPNAAVHATDIDPIAVACARANGVPALVGDLDAPLPPELRGNVDVVVAVVPYVPTEALHLLPRDTLAFEPVRAIDGGPSGTRVLERVIGRSPTWLLPGGRLFLEIGGEQSDLIAPLLDRAGFDVTVVLADEDGQDRGIAALLRG